MVPPPLGFLLALQGGLLLLVASGMLLLSLPFGQAGPKDLFYALVLFLSLAALDDTFRHLLPVSFRHAENLHL
ncbi:CPBP family intramembrane metalloprotease, partial [Thermus scotoductus]